MSNFTCELKPKLIINCRMTKHSPQLTELNINSAVGLVWHCGQLRATRSLQRGMSYEQADQSEHG
jgi:hypothetical protein